MRERIPLVALFGPETRYPSNRTCIPGEGHDELHGSLPFPLPHDERAALPLLFAYAAQPHVCIELVGGAPDRTFEPQAMMSMYSRNIVHGRKQRTADSSAPERRIGADLVHRRPPIAA